MKFFKKSLFSFSTKVTPFHLAVPVRDIKEARNFYGNILGLPEGRSSNKWIDYNFGGN